MLVIQSCQTLCDPMDCSPPGSSVQGILQARILKWVGVAWDKTAIQIKDYFSRGKPILVKGPFENDPYTDKDGRLRDSWSLKVRYYEFLLSDPTQKQKAGHVTEIDSFKAAEDDIPF